MHHYSQALSEQNLNEQQRFTIKLKVKLQFNLQRIEFSGNLHKQRQDLIKRHVEFMKHVHSLRFQEIAGFLVLKRHKLIKGLVNETIQEKIDLLELQIDAVIQAALQKSSVPERVAITREVIPLYDHITQLKKFIQQ
ncbi:hypothetical protein OXYTRIMIC_208 [Oxytricha trifallax]|uniref:Uncharacterized protein n=1 Tax=Oxytricha trifallax TaxID=1172189 RepID=A0A073I0B3_9SPIT|nr:hypothetical protein OXYTRIMIC_208 [Oxytricha trifallax]